MTVGSGEERINKPTAGCGASDSNCVAGLLVLLAPRLTCAGLRPTGGTRYRVRNQNSSLASKFLIRNEGQRQPNST